MNCLRIRGLGAFTQLLITASFVAGTALGADAPSRDKRPALRVLVVTGGHSYDKPTFEALFRSLEGIDARMAQEPKASDEFAPDRRDTFDVVVLYDMIQYTTDKQRHDFLDMLRQGKGLVVMHHAIGARQSWDEYFKVIGGRYYIRGKTSKENQPKRVSTYREGVSIKVLIKDKAHPITAGMPNFEVIDEVYKNYDVADGVHVLLGTDHPENEPTLAWTNTYGASRVVYLQLGHGPGAFNDSNFRELVARSIRWAAKLPDAEVATADYKPGVRSFDHPDEGAGWIRLFNGKDLSDWEVMGDKAGWQILSGGIIRSEGAKGGGWLRYAKGDFGDFVLRVQWRVSKDGNSGVFIRAKREGNPWITGHEIQITNAPRDDAHCTGSLYGSVAVKPRPDESPGTWHEFEIRAEGEHIIVISDGVKVIDATHSACPDLRSRPLRGAIGLQDAHAGPGKWIEWRNIRLKRLGR